MEPYYDYMNTHGTVNAGAGVNRNGTQFFGTANGTSSPMSLPKKMTLLQLIQEPTINLWGMSGLGDEHAAAPVTAPPQEDPTLLSFQIVGGLAVSFALGRFVAVPLIEYFSKAGLTQGQKTAVGVTAMIF